MRHESASEVGELFFPNPQRATFFFFFSGRSCDGRIAGNRASMRAPSRFHGSVFTTTEAMDGKCGPLTTFPLSLSAGAHVAILGRSKQSVEAAASSLSQQTNGVLARAERASSSSMLRSAGMRLVFPVVCDVRDASAVRAAVEAVHDAMGVKHINVLVNAAGINKDALLIRLVFSNHW